MSAYPLGSYVIAKFGKLSNLPMKIKSHDKQGKYWLEHPTTHEVFGYIKSEIRPAKRKEIEQIRILR